MNEVKRYIIIKGIRLDSNEIIPIWDPRIKFDKSKDFGCSVSVDVSYKKYHNFVDCIYDLKTKFISIGIELDYYPNKKDVQFKIGESVLHELSHRVLEDSKIKDIVFEEYDVEIKRGNKLDDWWVKRFPDVTFEPDQIYAIKSWKPFYILESGEKIKWEHQLYHKKQ